MNRLIKALKKSTLSNTRKKVARRRKKTVVPQLQRNPQRLGIGTTEARVTRVIQAVANSNTDYELLSNAFSSYEFSRQAEDYNFCRVKCINVIQHPINVSDVDGQVWLYMDWLDDGNNQSTLGTCDNAKMLSYNATRPLVYTFLPPNARLRRFDNEGELSYQDLPLNYCEWLPAKAMLAKSTPGWLRILNIGNKPITVTVDVVFQFRGSKAYDPNLLSSEQSKTMKFITVKPYQGITKVKDEPKLEDLFEEEEEKEVKEEKKKKKNVKRMMP